ncbi:polysaccharide biosynthesis/export family protein [Chitinophaga sp.]|uniref:polysaccharide biosynthesis/export family protein n=1 Tax=Chitinophaga sp. TaxID=1869181 RepID=UPI0031CF3155
MRISTTGHQKKALSVYLYVVALLMFATISSCTSTKNITYFNDVADSVKWRSIEQAGYTTPVIQPDDILQVNIQTLDPSATAMLNQQSWPTGSSAQPALNNASVSPTNVSGYLVDKNGYVILPLLGKVAVAGKTTDQVRDEISTKAAEFYKEPVVNVRFANFKVTVLGEVAKPATYVMPNEKITLLDAIGMAGDLTIYGKRENVLLIRDNNNKKEFVRFDLNKSNTFQSPYFYLRQGDVVYVEPSKARVAATDSRQVRRITILTSVLTLLVVIVSRVKL